MKNLEKQLLEVIELAKEWRSFSRDTAGPSTEHYTGDGLSVRCYFAVSGDHTSVDFDSEFGSGVQIGFFDPIHIEFTTSSMNRLDVVLEKGRALLNKCREEQGQITAQEIAERREQEKETLKKRLAELDAESPQS